MSQSNIILTLGTIRYINCQKLEAAGWVEECPSPKDQVFSHPKHGRMLYQEAIKFIAQD